MVTTGGSRRCVLRCLYYCCSMLSKPSAAAAAPGTMYQVLLLWMELWNMRRVFLSVVLVCFFTPPSVWFSFSGHLTAPGTRYYETCGGFFFSRSCLFFYAAVHAVLFFFAQLPVIAGRLIYFNFPRGYFLFFIFSRCMSWCSTAHYYLFIHIYLLSMSIIYDLLETTDRREYFLYIFIYLLQKEDEERQTAVFTAHGTYRQTDLPAVRCRRSLLL